MKMFKPAAAVAGLLLLASCAGTQSPSPQARSELAPTGTLRVAINLGNRLFAKKEANGEVSGIAADLGRELGRRIGAPVEILGFDSGGQMTTGLGKGGWDVAFMAYEPAREAEVAFAGAFAEVDSTYLVPAASPLRNAAEVDREGVRIAVSAGGGNDLFLTRTIKRAQLVRATGSAAALKTFTADKLEAFAGLKPTLIELSAKLPGTRVLDGRYTVIPYSVGAPRGRDAGNRYLREFLEEAKTSGLIARSIEKNGIRGVSVAPAAPTVRIGGGSGS
jgi:polar amino acid transport system substrate-binding protein